MYLFIFPIIPVIAGLAIIGGTGALVWYSNQSKSQRDNANRLALQWFGKRFKELAEHQQKKVIKQIGKRS